ncbi:hypothetical protein K1W54_25515 [Micromonospora sp. CPCC 205371]|nr:hypothetical protein [Micromonospora sp. CPCC 205371]
MTSPSGEDLDAWPVTRRAHTIRRVVAIPFAAVASPILALYAYLLLWWLPALTGPSEDPCDPMTAGRGACWQPEQRTFWLVAATATILCTVCLVMSVTRTWRVRRWWPWPVAAAVLLFLGGLAVDRVP